MAEYRTRIIYIVDELGLSTARVIDRSIDANPFHRSDVFYQYIGVYDYTTVSGRYNVVPVFKIVYPLDPDKLN